MNKKLYSLFFIILLFGCKPLEKSVQNVREAATPFENPPEWAKGVIWYEIAVERFRNGDTSNDPTPDDIKGSYPGFVPEGWQVTPWTP